MWQEVVAVSDLRTSGTILVAGAVGGIVVGQLNGDRIVVKFDERADGHSTCVNVLPSEITLQLSPTCGFRIGQRVVAVRDLMFGTVVGVRHGICGVVTGRSRDRRITVSFDERADRSSNGVNVVPSEIQPCRPLPGGFRIAQRVVASRDLFANDHLLVQAGTSGVVMCLYSETRVTVTFAGRADGSTHPVNVTAGEIQAAA